MSFPCGQDSLTQANASSLTASYMNLTKDCGRTLTKLQIPIETWVSGYSTKGSLMMLMMIRPPNATLNQLLDLPPVRFLCH